MKKTLLALALVCSLVTAKAEAHPWLCAPPAAAAGGAGGTVLFTGGMAAFLALPILIVELQPYHVWNYVFPVVEESFPGDKHFPQGVKQVSVAPTPKHLAYVGSQQVLTCDGSGCM